mmetsp:Transcript_11706/g.17794  ORF Transcript_11706/g.17794 Transcript_11706/m.17794 type:complete len:80 (+) Transcript_11706:1501-1740(+)
MTASNDKWNLMVREVIDILRGTQSSKAISKTFQSQIADEIVKELREKAENSVITKCKDKYSTLLRMGFFKVPDTGIKLD